jgi:hypothetical protein
VSQDENILYAEFSYVDQGEAQEALSEAKSFVEAGDKFLSNRPYL